MHADTAYHLGMEYKRHAAGLRQSAKFYNAVIDRKDADELERLAQKLDEMVAKMRRHIEDDYREDPTQKNTYISVLDHWRP